MSPDLQAVAARVLGSGRAGGFRAGAAALSAHYREGGRSDGALDLGAYLTVRMPATLAAVSRVLQELRRLRPDFAPATLVDMGAGPGTASWAAVAAWPGIARVTMADTNHEFLALAGKLAEASSSPALRYAAFVRADMTGAEALPRAALVVAAYALAEVAERDVPGAAAALWQATSGMLVLVEPGTPAGFARIRTARDTLLQAGAAPVAPCPHGAACPMAGGGWCHFSVRLARSRAHMHAKAARVPFEDEKFSYLIVSRTGQQGGGGRILAPPLEQKPGITFKLCTAAGIENHHIARRDAAAYKAHRKLLWGDLLEPSMTPGKLE